MDAFRISKLLLSTLLIESPIMCPALGREQQTEQNKTTQVPALMEPRSRGEKEN